MSNIKKMIITDNIDLSSKQMISKDEFYSNKKSNYNLKNNDFYTLDSSKIENDKEMLYYALVSTAGKIINYRDYDNDSWKKTVIDKLWISPYKKPILYNHDLYFSSPQGRIVNTFFINHQNKEVEACSYKETLPNEVINFYDSIGSFSEGTGSVIARFQPNDILAERIKNELDLTVSQSSYMSKAVCNICGKNYFSSECTHYPGETYEVEEDGVTKKKMCIVKTYDFEPIELSFVNLPANDTSVVYVYKLNSQLNNDSKIIDNNHISENIEKDNKEEEKDKKNNDNEKEGGNLQENMEDKFKNMLKKTVEDRLGINDESSESFNKLFDSMNSEQVEEFIKIVDFLENKNKKIEDKLEKEEENKAEELKEKEEQKDNSEKKDELKEKEEQKDSSEKGEEKEELKGKEEQKESSNDSKEKPIEKFYKDSKETESNVIKYDSELEALINSVI